MAIAGVNQTVINPTGLAHRPIGEPSSSAHGDVTAAQWERNLADVSWRQHDRPLSHHERMEVAMLGVLLESRSRPQRRSGGAALSVAVHMAVIAAVTAHTVHGRTAPADKPKVVVLRFAQPTVRPPVVRTVTSSGPTSLRDFSSVVIRRVSVPTFVPRSLPPVDLSSGAAFDSIVISGSGSGSGAGPRSVIDGEGTAGSTEWRGRELLMRIERSVKPRYPESLRQSGIDGRVVVQFAVDTAGRVDPASIRVLSSTHDLFTHAVRDAIVQFRFMPAEVGGRRVPALAEMPFEFQISNR
jgi:protein TonB